MAVERRRGVGLHLDESPEQVVVSILERYGDIDPAADRRVTEIGDSGCRGNGGDNVTAERSSGRCDGPESENGACRERPCHLFHRQKASIERRGFGRKKTTGDNTEKTFELD